MDAPIRRIYGKSQNYRSKTKLQYLTAIAAVKNAEYEQTQALLGFNLAVADLDRIIGSYANP